jgi:hypothetical protein
MKTSGESSEDNEGGAPVTAAPAAEASVSPHDARRMTPVTPPARKAKGLPVQTEMTAGDVYMILPRPSNSTNPK